MIDQTSVDTWESALAARTDLQRYGDNAIGLFALALRFSLEDLDSVAAEALTDGADDKKCDLVYVDPDESAAVIAQCYFSKAQRIAAPSGKAADLNTAMAWLLQSGMDRLPARLKSPATELRGAIKAGTITDLHIWYVHNVPESANVKNELDTVEANAHSALKHCFPNSSVRVHTLEIGASKLSEWYADSLSPILVNDSFNLTIPDGFSVHSEGWEAFVTAVPARFLHRVYKKYKTKLFSANVRDYLGSRKSDQNINHGIKQTAETAPANFWVFNNGVTILVNKFERLYTSKGPTIQIEGLSIVNGAQTTGAIGSLKKAPDASALVPVRFIKTSDRGVLYDIIRYNNSQNKVTAPDFRSTDRIQKRLKDEMQKIPCAEYEGGRRGGHEDVIRRRAYLLPSYTVGQALAALHGDAVVAYNDKANIWIQDVKYAKYFNDETTATHILFAYALLRAVEAKKLELVDKSKLGALSLTASEQKQLEFFRNRGATYLLATAIAACLETFLGRRIPNFFRLSFGPAVSPSVAQSSWMDIVHITAPLCTHLEEAFTYGLSNSERVKKAVQTFQGLVEVTASANEKRYKAFATRVLTA